MFSYINRLNEVGGFHKNFRDFWLSSHDDFLYSFLNYYYCYTYRWYIMLKIPHNVRNLRECRFEQNKIFRATLRNSLLIFSFLLKTDFTAYKKKKEKKDLALSQVCKMTQLFRPWSKSWDDPCWSKVAENRIKTIQPARVYLNCSS